MLSVLIFVILAISLFVNYKKTIIFILVFFTWISAFSLWGKDIMTFLGTLAVLLFPLKMGIHKITFHKFPLKIPNNPRILDRTKEIYNVSYSSKTTANGS